MIMDLFGQRHPMVRTHIELDKVIKRMNQVSILQTTTAL